MRLPRIGIIGDYHPGVRSHNALSPAIASAARQLGGGVETSWVNTIALDQHLGQILSRFNGLWCVPGGPCKNQEGTVVAIRFASEKGLPLLATGSACQLVMLEYLRNVLVGPPIPRLSALSATRSMLSQRIVFKPKSRLASIYDSPETDERYCCRFNFEPEWEPHFTGSELRFSGRDIGGGVRAVVRRFHLFSSPRFSSRN